MKGLATGERGKSARDEGSASGPLSRTRATLREGIRDEQGETSVGKAALIAVVALAATVGTTNPGCGSNNGSTNIQNDAGVQDDAAVQEDAPVQDDACVPNTADLCASDQYVYANTLSQGDSLDVGGKYTLTVDSITDTAAMVTLSDNCGNTVKKLAFTDGEMATESDLGLEITATAVASETGTPSSYIFSVRVLCPVQEDAGVQDDAAPVQDDAAPVQDDASVQQDATPQQDAYTSACTQATTGTYSGMITAGTPKTVGGYVFEYLGAVTQDGGVRSADIKISCGGSVVTPDLTCPLGTDTVEHVTADHKKITVNPLYASQMASYVTITVANE